MATIVKRPYGFQWTAPDLVEAPMFEWMVRALQPRAAIILTSRDSHQWDDSVPVEAVLPKPSSIDALEQALSHALSKRL